MTSTRILSLTFLLILLASCTSSRTSNSYITKQEAIDTALEVASTSWPEISGPQEQPSNIQAEQMALQEALKKINNHNQPPNGYDSDTIVWLITMDGLWLDEMEAPGVALTPAPYHHYAIIIDAETGSQIQSSYLP